MNILLNNKKYTETRHLTLTSGYTELYSNTHLSTIGGVNQGDHPLHKLGFSYH